jgi:flavodoxin
MKPKRPALVVYYSLSGNTERVARDLAARMGADIATIRERKVRRGVRGYLRAAIDSALERQSAIVDLDQRPEDYSLTVVGTPIWMGRMTPAVRACLKAVRYNVHEIAFFTTSGSTDSREVVAEMERIAEKKAVASAGFDQRVLQSGPLYEQKIGAFVAALQAGHESPTITDAIAPAHA